MAKISVVINTLNEEAQLPDCLAGVSRDSADFILHGANEPHYTPFP